MKPKNKKQNTHIPKKPQKRKKTSKQNGFPMNVTGWKKCFDNNFIYGVSFPYILLSMETI